MKKMQRKGARVVSIVLAMALLLAGCFVFPAETKAEESENPVSDTVTVQVTGKYGQTEARTMLDMVNNFRTGSDAWYWNSDNTTKTTQSDLGLLTYDYDLEKAAMQRAMEIALAFEHTRPNGERCFTAYSEGYSSKGENIAAGYTSAADAFEGWAEADENYDGQGHRRNMLKASFTAIGIGHVYYNGTHYWVQEFGSPVSSTIVTTANDSVTTVSVEVAGSNIADQGISVSSDSITVTYGQSAELPTATAWILLKKAWPGDNCPIESQPVWTGDSSYYTLGESAITGTAAGTDIVTVTAAGMSKSVTVNVEAASISSGRVTLDLSTPYTYTGSAVTPAVSSVVVGGKTLTEGTDYDVAYSNNVNAGTAYVTVTGKGNYKDSIRTSFPIYPAVTQNNTTTGDDNTASQDTVAVPGGVTITQTSTTDPNGVTAPTSTTTQPITITPSTQTTAPSGTSSGTSVSSSATSGTPSGTTSTATTSDTSVNANASSCTPTATPPTTNTATPPTTNTATPPTTNTATPPTTNTTTAPTTNTGSTTSGSNRIVTKSDGTLAIVNGSGAPVASRVVTIGSNSYITNEQGTVIQNSFATTSKGNTVYAGKDGAILKNTTITVSGKKYYAKASGAIAKNGFFKTASGNTVYASQNGVLKVGKLFKVKGNRYIAKASGAIAKNTWTIIGNKKYYSDQNGVVTKTKKLW
jgi:hypothetical protein